MMTMNDVVRDETTRSVEEERSPRTDRGRGQRDGWMMMETNADEKQGGGGNKRSGEARRSWAVNNVVVVHRISNWFGFVFLLVFNPNPFKYMLALDHSKLDLIKCQLVNLCLETLFVAH